jgi:pyrimidine deaminase RibD-like protein
MCPSGFERGQMTNDERFMRMALEAARQSKAEDARAHPLVGVVVVRDGATLVEAHRGELGAGDHAEFTALEKKLAGEPLAGATVYTTLEPCTTRNHPKLPCAERLIERKVARVVIGMLDPNPKISGKGQRRLREANIATELFPAHLMAEVEELNRDFIREQKRADEAIIGERSLILKNQTRRLDDWYRILNRIYWNRNYERSMSSIFTHLVEVVGGLSLLASSKKKPNVDPEGHIVKAFAWWLALCGKAGVRSVENMLWDKFPALCPYCHKRPHDPDICSERKALAGGPPWTALAELGKSKEKPARLRDWQLMFSDIYPAQQTEEFCPSFARFRKNWVSSPRQCVFLHLSRDIS